MTDNMTATNTTTKTTTNTTTMNAFELSELKGRAKVMNALYEIDFNEGKDFILRPTTGYCRWDFDLLDKETSNLLAVIEVKDRNLSSTDWRVTHEGVHLDSDKYDAIKRYADKKGVDAFFFATFTDNVGILWDFNCKTDTHTRFSNKTTCVESYKVEKDFRLFTLADYSYKATLK